MVTARRRSYASDEVAEILLRAIKRTRPRTAGDLIDVVRGRVEVNDRQVYRILARLSDEGKISRIGQKLSPESGYVLGGVPKIANAWHAIGVCMRRGFESLDQFVSYITI